MLSIKSSISKISLAEHICEGQSANLAFHIGVRFSLSYMYCDPYDVPVKQASRLEAKSSSTILFSFLRSLPMLGSSSLL